jgi:hypothetical protein
MKLTRLLSGDEHTALGDDCVSRGLYRNDRRVYLPGMGFLNPWYWDPTGDRQRAGKYVMCKGPGAPFLSPHYWRDWATKRPPITVICPNGELWEIDRQSSNGDGWKVEGEWPNLTCTPSIVAGDYHGFLRNGEFTPDLDGKNWPIPNIRPDYGKVSA